MKQYLLWALGCSSECLEKSLKKIKI